MNAKTTEVMNAFIENDVERKCSGLGGCKDRRLAENL
jgi:hypothetical protein